MANFYLVRHGEADYSAIASIGFFGFGRDLAPLSEKGIKQAETAALDKRLQDAEFIICSPYTRALQTASIISRVTGKKIVIEPELHEWVPDKTNTYSSTEEAIALTHDFQEYNGVYPTGRDMKWESLVSMRERMKRVFDKYAEYDKIIVVGHGMAFRTISYIEEMSPAEIMECTYHKNQDDCEYSFY